MRLLSTPNIEAEVKGWLKSYVYDPNSLDKNIIPFESSITEIMTEMLNRYIRHSPMVRDRFAVSVMEDSKGEFYYVVRNTDSLVKGTRAVASDSQIYHIFREDLKGRLITAKLFPLGKKHSALVLTEKIVDRRNQRCFFIRTVARVTFGYHEIKGLNKHHGNISKISSDAS